MSASQQWGAVRSMRVVACVMLCCVVVSVELSYIVHGLHRLSTMLLML